MEMEDMASLFYHQLSGELEKVLFTYHLESLSSDSTRKHYFDSLEATYLGFILSVLGEFV